MTSEQKKEFEVRRLHALRMAFYDLGYDEFVPDSAGEKEQAGRMIEIAKQVVEKRVARLKLQADSLAAEVARLDKAEAEYDSKFHCDIDGCDQPHCRKCGRHSDGVGETCAACEVERARAEMEAVSAAFGGNHEAAAKHMGW